MYAILSDMHGRRTNLKRALCLAREAGAERFIFLGDYVGYGRPDPAGVIDLIVHLQQHDAAICIRGNHDQAPLEYTGRADARAELNAISQWAPL